MRGSTLRRAAIASRIWRALEKAPIAEWKVPPENVALERATPRIVTGPVAPSCWIVK